MRWSLLTNFVGEKVTTKNKVLPMEVKQHENETFREKVNCFNKATNAAMDYTDDNALTVAYWCILPELRFAYSIQKKPPKTFGKFHTHARYYINIKEMNFTISRKS